MNGVGRLNTTCETTVSIPEDSDEAKEVIEVQILPQVTFSPLWTDFILVSRKFYFAFCAF